MVEPPRPIPPQLEVIPLVDPLVEAYGFDPRSLYVEHCWLPVLGPTSTWLYRRLGTWAASEALTVDSAELALGVGLGEGLSKSSLLAKGIGRLAGFHVVEWRGERLAVRRSLAPVPERMIARYGKAVVEAHRRMVAGKVGFGA